MFWQRFYELCSKGNTSPNSVVKALGLSSGSVTSWKNGKVPHHNTLIDIADYFNCSVDYLLGRADKKSNSMAKAEELTNDECDLIQNYRNLNDEGKEKVRDYISDIVFGGRYKKDNASGMVQNA